MFKKRFNIPDTSLGVQIGFVTAVCVLLATLVFGSITAHYQSTKSLDSLRNEARIFAEVIADSAANFLLFKDFVSIEEKLLKISVLENFHQADIIRHDGRLLSSVILNDDGAYTTRYSSKPVDVPASYFPREHVLDDQIIKWLPFNVQNEHFWVKLVINTESVDREYELIYTRTILVGIAAATISFIILVLFLNPRLHAIRELTTFAENMEASSGKQIEVGKNAREISALNHALNNASTRLRFADEQIRDSEYELRKIVENMPVMMFAFDQNWNIIVWNRECERVTGFKEYEIRLNTEAFKYLFPSQIDLEMFHQQWRNTQDFHSQEWVLRSRNGNLKTISLSNISNSFPIKGWSAWGIAVNITDRVEAENNVRNYRDELAHASRVSTVGELASGLAHEINQPLSAIMNYASAGSYRLAKASDNDISRECFLEISKQAERAGNIVNNLQHFMRKRTSVQSQVTLNSIFKQTRELTRVEAEKYNISLRISPCDEDITLFADVIQITQVLLNLCKNAIEAMHEANSRQRIVHISHQMEHDQIQISIADTGPGIAEDSNEIFQPFYSTKSQGMGLGLSISTSIIESHGGKLWFNYGGHMLIDDKMIEQGCTFTFSLPLYKYRESTRPRVHSVKKLAQT